ncbi:hypothetical protein CIK52_13675 [Kocuria rosea]|jgi:hypothetical protein|uniref:TasA family protein n=1 Tax=Kocuria TaxID=57493 RepID=UPI000D65ECC3|nr:TasA family protein [Kocuria rosea]MEB2527210.1 TasA family protein [Kocuria rosea]MEB2619478.1 TasA family protein [Kocuria rosea]PWF83982.1 hypothetical protein CIK52_13675 [Kocuria rosea]QCY34446.1 hypothetical protein EQG70_17485 [Kocuria rosea]TQN38710.1 camelysin-like metallo-endopeptidase [Kocuria rosea]
MTATAVATVSRPRRYRVLVPLAGLAAAAALAVGSGADFTSNSVNSANAFSTGSLTQTNSKANSAVFNLDNMKPGDTLNGSVTITNSGSLGAGFKLTETATNGFTTKSNLRLTITESGSTAPVWTGTFGELTAAGPLVLGDWAPGQAKTFVFSVTLDSKADNTEQGKTATATYSWDAVQSAGTTTDQ